MNDYLHIRYGDPCRMCGYLWFTDDEICRQRIEEAPRRFAALVEGHSGGESCTQLRWNLGAYVAHVGDTIHHWAVRLASVAVGSNDPVVPYDEGVLGDVLGYTNLSLGGSLWSLERAALDWNAAEALVALNLKEAVHLDHPEQGRLGLEDARRILAHEIEHHAQDVSIILTGQPESESRAGL